MRVVVVGYGPGGVSAAVTAKTFSPDSEVVIITEEEALAHKKPGSTLAFAMPETDSLDISDWSFGKLRNHGIEVMTGTHVGDIKPTEKTVSIAGAQRESSMSYDKLILATGGVPAMPTIPGTELEGVYTIQNRIDASNIGLALNKHSVFYIVGAGFSGLEAAEQLHNLGKEVHLVVRSRIMRRLLEPEMSQELRSRMPDDIVLHTGDAPTEVMGEQRVQGVRLGGEEFSADAVLFMTGVKPNIGLARRMGLVIGNEGGISVSRTMETSQKDVYAVGDCVEMSDFITGKPVLMPIGSVAARAGRQAGAAAVGSSKIYEDTTLRFQYDRIFDFDTVCVGHSSVISSGVGVRATVEYVEDSYEGSKIALLTDHVGRLIGGQVITSRMGAKLGYEILARIQEGAKLAEKPLTTDQHSRMKSLLERTLGPIE